MCLSVYYSSGTLACRQAGIVGRKNRAYVKRSSGTPGAKSASYHQTFRWNVANIL